MSLSQNVYLPDVTKKRPRTERREAERAQAKLADARIKLATLEAGGAPDRAIAVGSASVIEVHAAGLPCVACGEAVRIDEHIAGDGLRVVRVRCPRCGHRREIFFRISMPS